MADDKSTEEYRTTRRLAIRMVALGWLAQNAMTGLVFGSYGTLINTFEREFHVTRSVSTLGMALVLLSLSLFSPIVGILVQRISIRNLMIAGAVVCAAGFGLLASAHNMVAVLLAYGLLIGPGSALLGSMLPSALVSNWFAGGRGRALGIVNMTVFIGVVPLVSSWLLVQYGLSVVFTTFAAVMLCVIPLLLMVIDRPEQRGLRPFGTEEAAHTDGTGAVMTYGQIVRLPSYWLITSSGCILAASGVTIATHVVPLALGWGYALSDAALLLTLVGAFGAVGSPLYGWLADRVGGTGAIIINAVVQLILWSMLQAHLGQAAVLVIVSVLGMSTGGMMATFNTALSNRFGAQNFSRTYGLFVLVNLPFTVAVPPLVGYVFVVTGSYTEAFLGIVAAMVIVVALCAALHFGDVHNRRNRERLARAAIP